MYNKKYKLRGSLLNIKINYMKLQDRCSKIKKTFLKFINSIDCCSNKNNTPIDSVCNNDILTNDLSDIKENNINTEALILEIKETSKKEKIQDKIDNDLEKGDLEKDDLEKDESGKDTTVAQPEYMNVNIDIKESEDLSDEIIISNKKKDTTFQEKISIQPNIHTSTLNPLHTDFQIIEGDGTKELEKMVYDTTVVMDISILDEHIIVDEMSDSIDILNDSDSSYDLCN